MAVCSALAFNMVEHAANAQIRVSDNLSGFCVVFIAVLLNRHILPVGSMEDLIDDRNHQPGHFFQHGTEYIIENSVVTKSAFVQFAEKQGSIFLPIQK